MGVNTDAILFFGIDLGEDEMQDWPWNNTGREDYEWWDYVAEKLGIVGPDVSYDGHEKAYREYWDRRHAAVEQLGCEIGIHCSESYPCTYVALTGKKKKANRGYPNTVDKSFLDVTEDDVDKLKKFCELVGIPWQEPSWLLASYWSE
jgi:hypothetical protein